MLEEHNIEYTYREYKKNPLSKKEITDMLKKLGEPANTLLRKRDKAYKELSLTGKEDDAALIPLFAKYPTLMQRPIFIHNSKAVVGRPIENMLTIIS